MAGNFYRWRARDFVEIRAEDLQAGDEIMWSHGSEKVDRYGAIPIENVVYPQGSDIVLLQLSLPEGAFAQSTSDCEISIFWERGKLLIYVAWWINRRQRVCIRRK